MIQPNENGNTWTTLPNPFPFPASADGGYGINVGKTNTTIIKPTIGVTPILQIGGKGEKLKLIKDNDE